MHTNEENMLKLYVSPAGNDAWSGKMPNPNAKKTDGPLASLVGIQALLRLMKTGKNNHPSTGWVVDQCLSAPVTVYLRGGIYAMKTPLILSAEDSWPVTFKPTGTRSR